VQVFIRILQRQKCQEMTFTIQLVKDISRSRITYAQVRIWCTIIDEQYFLSMLQGPE